MRKYSLNPGKSANVAYSIVTQTIRMLLQSVIYGSHSITPKTRVAAPTRILPLFAISEERGDVFGYFELSEQITDGVRCHL